MILWHKRLGHIGSRGLQELCKQGILDPKIVWTLDFCEFCALGKSHKLKFNIAKHKTKSILKYIHSDLWGSSNIPYSMYGAQYNISFVDDFSRKV